jgi:hypothetical protein
LVAQLLVESIVIAAYDDISKEEICDEIIRVRELKQLVSNQHVKE